MLTTEPDVHDSDDYCRTCELFFPIRQRYGAQIRTACCTALTILCEKIQMFDHLKLIHYVSNTKKRAFEIFSWNEASISLLESAGWS